jgi:phage terminase large subunit-like protein
MTSAMYKYRLHNRHQKQKAFHQNPARNRWVFGGNRTGKTECGAVEAVYWASCDHPSRTFTKATSGWVVSLSTQVQRDVAQAKILRYLNKNDIVEIIMISGRRDSPQRGIIDYILIKNRLNTISKIGFRNCDQGREKFQGTSLDWVWFDEEPPHDIYQECLLRTMDRPNSCIWGTMTPLKGRTWVYEQIYLNPSQDPSISTTHMQWSDNPYLNEDEIKKMEASLSSDVLQTRKYGHFMDGTGLVFPEFSELNVIDMLQIQNEWYTAISIDPGFTNPLAVLWLSVDPDENYYVVADYSVSEKTVEHHAAAIRQISQQLNFPQNQQGNYDAIIDSAALQHTLGSPTSVAEQFAAHGIDVDARVNKTISEGIMRLKGLFCDVHGRRKLFITRNCTNLIRELKSYWWGNNEKPVKRDDHCIDALRYFVTYDWRALQKISSPPKYTTEQRTVLNAKNSLIQQNRANR